MRRIKIVVALLALLFSTALWLTGSRTATPHAVAANRSIPSGPVVARITFPDKTALDALAAEIDVWEVDHSRSQVVAMLRPQEYEALRNRGLLLVIDEDRTALLEQPPVQPDQSDGIPGYPCYRTVEETYEAMSSLAAQHPSLASWTRIGDSWRNVVTGGTAGYGVFALVLGNKSVSLPKPKFFLMAAIHARELATAELATRFAEYLLSNYGSDPDITWLLDYSEVHIVPIVNPDGRKFAEQGYYWRKNSDNDDGCTSFPSFGTDLNRNSSFYWGMDTGNPCAETYRGPSAASEPEVSAIQDYVASIFPDQRGSADADPAPDDATGVFVTLHSYGGMVLFPWGWQDYVTPNDAQLQTLGRKFGYFNRYEVCQAGPCLYSTSGATDDWAYGVLGVAAYTFELGTAFFQSCYSFENTILPANRAALLYAGKAARRPYQAPSGPESLSVSVASPVVAPGTVVTLTASADDTRFASNGHGEEQTQRIAAARYTVDSPSWVAGVVAHRMDAADGSYDSAVESVAGAVDTTGWAIGRHLVLVESQDADGNWGVPTATFLEVASYAVAVDPATDAAAAPPGDTITFVLRVTNAGAASDRYAVAVGHTARWNTVFPQEIGPLAPGEVYTIGLTVEVPVSAADGGSDVLEVTVTSRGDASRYGESTLTATARWRRVLLPLVVK